MALSPTQLEHFMLSDLKGTHGVTEVGTIQLSQHVNVSLLAGLSCTF